MYPHANGQSATRLIYNKSRYIIKTGLGGTTYLPSRVRAVSTKAFAPGTFYIPYSNGQTAMRVLYDNLQWLKFDKWGYVLYRCTYDDDYAWARFKDIIYERARQRVILDETPEALDMLDFTGIEDKKELNGISRAELRVRHKRWAAEALLRENPRASPEILSPWV
ncbi:hypothetical protein OHC33_006270 [Knufia fluminis]|uniref:Uncharacterized protein n=1 Tax=Knufia fluminis TaxID=191047 RepID=A0AAN8EUW4_9EURO|nr:hypothetical protein OHC33_006270 [Knufia fluminis]